MFGVSFPELLVLGTVALLVLGPEKLPGMLRTMGQWVTKLRRLTTEVRYQSGIDDVLRAEGFEGGLNELRSIMRGGVQGPSHHPPARAPVAETFVSDKSREYPSEGPDAYGALPEDLVAPPPGASPEALAPPTAPTALAPSAAVPSAESPEALSPPETLSPPAALPPAALPPAALTPSVPERATPQAASAALVAPSPATAPGVAAPPPDAPAAAVPSPGSVPGVAPSAGVAATEPQKIAPPEASG